MDLYYTVEVIKATFMLSLPVFLIVGHAENEVKADIWELIAK